MATHEVDRKILGRLARDASAMDGRLSGALFQVLGLSRMISRRLFRARKLRRLDPTDEKAMTLYHHIIWMSREGLAIVEEVNAEYIEKERVGLEFRIFVYKLPGDLPQGEKVPTVLLPVPGNRQVGTGVTPPRNGKAKDPNDPSPPSRVPTGIRDSILSDTSNITNPFGSISGLSPPPGLPGRDPSQAPDPAAFLLPSTNFIPLTIASFDAAAALAAQALSGSSPLRLCIALEYSAFKWDCLHDHDDSRRLARRTITGVYQAQDPMGDDEFNDAANLVGTLNRMMKRQSQEATPRFGPESPAPNPANNGNGGPGSVPPPVPEVPQIPTQEERNLREEARREQRRAQREAQREEASRRPVTVERIPQPRQTQTQAASGLDKPLPDVPRQNPSHNIPRRPVGTPPGVKSTSRPSTASEEDLTPTQTRVTQGMTSAVASTQATSPPGSYPPRGSSLQQEESLQQASRPPRGSSLPQGRTREQPIINQEPTTSQAAQSSESRAQKRKNEGDDSNGASSNSGAKSFIPRLRVRNP